MKITAQKISSLLRQADIEGYIELGAPTDEYDSEAEALSLAFAELNDDEVTIENIATIITEAWKQSFNLDDADMKPRSEAIASLARMIAKNSNYQV